MIYMSFWGIPGVLVLVKDVEGTNLIFDSNTLVPAGATVNNDTFPLRLIQR